MNLILLGAPGAGKGTQAAGLSEILKIPHISTGVIFRDNIRRKTELGKLADAYISKGELVPDEVTVQIVNDRIQQDDCANGFILDGFPRNKEQADALDKIAKVDLVIHMNLSKEIAKERILNRLTCTECGNVTSKILTKSTKCTKCGGKLTDRADDTPQAVENRFEQYEKLTYPLLKKYQAETKVIELDATKPTSELLDIVLEVINEHNN